MPSRVRKFVCREFIKTVDLDLFRRFLERFPDLGGIAWSQLPQDEKEMREALFLIFQRSEELTDDLRDALYSAKILASAAGASKLIELAQKFGVELIPAAEADDAPGSFRLDTRSIALHAYIHHRAVFDRAVDLTRIWSIPRPLERAAAKSGIPSRHDDLMWKEEFRAAVSTYFQRKYCGQYCDVRWYPEGEQIGILVLHGKNIRTANVEENGEERALPLREIAGDTIRYCARDGWIKVGAASVGDAKMLLELFAKFLIGDETFFAGPLADDLYTLEPMEEAAAEFAFRYGWDPAVTKVVVREVCLDGGGTIGRRRRSSWRVTVSDDDNALTRLKTLGVELGRGGLGIAAAKLDFHLTDGSSVTTVPVSLRPPEAASFQDHAYEDVIYNHLELNGLRRASRPDPTALAAE